VDGGFLSHGDELIGSGLKAGYPECLPNDGETLSDSQLVKLAKGDTKLSLAVAKLYTLGETVWGHTSAAPRFEVRPFLLEKSAKRIM